MRTIVIKIGAPMIAVKIETGISAALMVLASVSTTIINTAPQLIAAVLVNATPVASTATIFCRKYNGNTSYTSRCVFFSTVFSLFTLVLVSATMSMG